MIEKSLLKYYKELNLSEDGVFVLAEEEEDKYIEKAIIEIEPHIDFFIINNFPKQHLSYDNVYAFSLKEFQSFNGLKYDIIQNNNPHSSHQINKVTKYWNKLKPQGLLILTLIDKGCVSQIERSLRISPEKWYEKDAVAIYKKP